MGSRLNFDGMKIRSLRIERGWTQEQLAEIAGISARTVQRAEAVNCAAFETLKAIAAAFETDFAQLLKPKAHAASDTKPQMESTAPGSGIETESGVGSPTPPVRRNWATPLIASSALAAGLVMGVLFTSRPDRREAFYSPAPRILPVTPPQTSTFREALRPDTGSKRSEPVLRKTAGLVAETSFSKKRPGVIADIPQNSSTAVKTEEKSSAADLVSQDRIHRSQEHAPLDLPLQSQSLLSDFAVPEEPIAGIALPNILTGEEHDSGAVRQAVDLASEKTGAFLSRVRSSIKRAFWY